MEVDYFQVYLKALMDEYQSLKKNAVKIEDIKYSEGMIDAIKHIGLIYLTSKKEIDDVYSWKRPLDEDEIKFLS